MLHVSVFPGRIIPNLYLLASKVSRNLTYKAFHLVLKWTNLQTTQPGGSCKLPEQARRHDWVADSTSTVIEE